MPSLGTHEAVEGENYGTPKEIYGLRCRTKGRTPRDRAEAFLIAHHERLGLDPKLRDFDRRVTVRRGLGTDHVIFKQLVHDHRVRRGYVSVHLERSGHVYLVKNRAVPQPYKPKNPFPDADEQRAIRKAIASLPRGDELILVRPVEKMWFPVGSQCVPVFRVRLRRHRPREIINVFVTAKRYRVLDIHDNVAHVRGRGRVFNPSPVTELGDHHTLLDEENNPLPPPDDTYQTVTLQGLDGNGYLEGKRVTTKPTHPSKRVWRKNHDFTDLESADIGFDEVMVYHHIDSAIRYLEDMGYKGNQRIFEQPLLVNANGTREDNAWYDPSTKSLTFGTGEIDEAEDGETILHEFGHALQDAICPEFGQSREGWAIGEGFGDYFAGSYFHARKPLRYQNSVISWDGLLIGIDEESEPPCMRRLDSDLTFDDYKPRGDEHDNGVIWSSTLWDVRRVIGPEIADQVIIESHFQLDPFVNFERAARAILDTNRILNRDRERKALRRVFRERKFDSFRSKDDE
jgi:hypothetical protein